MLRLITNKHNTNYSNLPTCRTNCSLYDPITDECGIWKNINVSNPKFYLSCNQNLPITSEDFMIDDLNEEYIMDDDSEALFTEIELQGKTGTDKLKYPYIPDIESNRDDAVWFVSHDKSFGCWIVNHYKKKLYDLNRVHKPKKQKRYYSPIPLHDHKTSKHLASHMCWYINPEGIGEYRFLANGKLLKIE